MKITLHLRIAGRVQGVGYRYSLAREAQANGINGWVRNLRDGSVEAVVHGETQAVRKIVEWAKRGPPAARVTQVDAQPAQGDLDRSYAGFEQLPTA